MTWTMALQSMPEPAASIATLLFLMGVLVMVLRRLFEKALISRFGSSQCWAGVLVGLLSMLLIIIALALIAALARG